MREQRTCIICGAHFYQFPSSPNKRCSIACRAISQQNPLPLAERLWTRVERTPTCWLQTTGLTHGGYGAIQVDGVVCYAHRVAWELASGAPVPAGLKILHTCDVKNCLRNDDAGTYEVNGKQLPRFGHLFIGTTADNHADMVAKGRDPRGDTHGLRLHPEAVARGERGSNARLTENDVREIRRLRAEHHVPMLELAAQFQIGSAHVAQIVHRKRWKHI